jgi:hypothetical protein
VTADGPRSRNSTSPKPIVNFTTEASLESRALVPRPSSRNAGWWRNLDAALSTASWPRPTFRLSRFTGPCRAARRRSSLLGRPGSRAGRAEFQRFRRCWATIIGTRIGTLQFWECKSEYMTDVVWQPLPPLWPSPAVSTDVGGFMLLVFTEDNVPTWKSGAKPKGTAAAAMLSFAAPRTHSKRLRQRRCLKRRPGPQNDETV